MEHIHVGVSPRAMARMKRGERVRMTAGDLGIFVKPERYNMMTKAFNKGKGLHVALDEDELSHNEGQGIFKKVKKAVVHTAKKVGRQVVKEGSKYLPELAGSAAEALAVALENPELAPMAGVAGTQLGEYASHKYTPQALDALRTHKQKGSGLRQPPSRHVSVDFLGNPALARANLGSAMANLESARMTAGEKMKNRPERTHVGVGGNLLQHHENPATTSKPLSANFQFRHTLPPQYQRIGSGRGLYA